MTSVSSRAASAVADGVPGVVAGIARPGGTEVGIAGDRAIGGPPMTRDTVFRIASVSKPIAAAAAMVLVERGQLALDDPVVRYMPELAELRVLRDPFGPLDETVPATVPLRVEHTLAMTAGWGWTEDFDSPHGRRLGEALRQGPPDPASELPIDEWVRALAATPLLHEPGQGWSYNTSIDVAGVVLARAAGSDLPAVLEDALFGPLGMVDTGFRIRPDQLDRTATFYRAEDDELVAVDGPDGSWAGEIPFPSAAGGLVSTLDDLLAFACMLAGGGEHDGRRVLAKSSVHELMRPRWASTVDHLFLGGAAWALGGLVDEDDGRERVSGRYGWSGGTGTSLYVYPRSQTAAVWLSQREMAGPADGARVEPFLTDAADRERAAIAAAG